MSNMSNINIDNRHNFQRSLNYMKILNIVLVFLPLISTFYLLTFLSATAFSQNHIHLGLPAGAKARLGKGRIHQVKYFPDGKRLAVATSIGIWIYDVQTGEALDLLTGHTEPVKTIVFSPDGETFASGSKDNTIRLWDTRTGKLKSTYVAYKRQKGVARGVNLLAFSPSGKTLASNGDIWVIKIWDLLTGNPIQTFSSDVNPLSAMTYSPDGAMLLTIGSAEKNESLIEYWDAQTGDHIEDVVIEENFNAAAISHDCKILATGDDGNPLQFWDVETGKLLRSYTEWVGEFKSMEFSSDGKTLITGSRWDRVDVWEISTAKLLRSMTHGDEVVSVTYSPDGKTIASGSDDGTIRFWDADTGDLIKTITGHLYSEFYSAAYSPDGSMLTCGSKSEIQFWDAQTGERLKTIKEPSCDVHSIAYSSEAKLLATGGTSMKARLWDVQTGRFLGSFAEHKHKTSYPYKFTILSVTFSPDGRTLASGGGHKRSGNAIQNTISENNIVSLWKIRIGELYPIGERLATFTEHTDWVSAVAFSPDGTTLASGSQDKTIQLWDINTRSHLKTLTGHEDGVTAVVYSPDGSTLVSGSQDGTIRLWHAHTGDLMLPPIEGAGQVTSLAYSPDGNLLASGSEDDNAVHVWNAQTGKRLQTFTGHTQSVNAVVFSPDGETLASVSEDGTILLWDLTQLVSDQ
ncbi:hypothetical protein C6501_19725 [Candidatus Poribacteria bacterium]|nr:MAG: hypothetical protein C6501_19725 [Candidatus Poribacteria bacterium]